MSQKLSSWEKLAFLSAACLLVLGGFLGLEAGTLGRYLSFRPIFVTDLWRILFSRGLQFPYFWNGILLSGVGPSLAFWPWSFKTQLPELRGGSNPMLLATWSPRSSLTTWSPYKQLPQRLKASLLRSSYKSSDPLLSTLPANPGFRWTHAGMHTYTTPTS